MKSRLSLLIGLVIVAFSVGVSAQHPSRLSEKELKDLLARMDKQAESFRSSLKSALNHSDIDHSKAEDRINDFVKGFEEATERLKHKFSDEHSASSEVEEVLRRAERINSFMLRHELSPKAESDWAALRSSLDSLAEAYGVSWTWPEHERDR
jgi:hypothetical protein